MNSGNRHNPNFVTSELTTNTQKSCFFSALYVRDSLNNYVMASESQILAEAERVITHRYPSGTIFSSSNVSREYFRAKLSGRDREVFAVAFLNNQHQLLAYIELFEGTISAVEVHPREIAREAMRLNASAVILSHNHPSFSPEPSQADLTITGRIRDALALLDVRIIDHIIVAGNQATSMADNGLVII